MPQPGRTAVQRQSSNGALVFRVDDDGPTRQLTALRFHAVRQSGIAGCAGQSYCAARAANASTTYALTSRICSGVNEVRNGGMSLLPAVTVLMTARRSLTPTRG